MIPNLCSTALGAICSLRRGATIGIQRPATASLARARLMRVSASIIASSVPIRQLKTQILLPASLIDFSPGRFRLTRKTLSSPDRLLCAFSYSIQFTAYREQYDSALGIRIANADAQDLRVCSSAALTHRSAAKNFARLIRHRRDSWRQDSSRREYHVWRGTGVPKHLNSSSIRRTSTPFLCSNRLVPIFINTLDRRRAPIDRRDRRVIYGGDHGSVPDL